MRHEAKDRDREIGARDGRTAEEVIASIDSSEWAVDPVAHGLTAMEYARGEAEMLASAFQQRAGGVNRFFHFPGLTRFGDTWIVSVNNDTVYSMAVVDAREGFTVEVPEVGERFVSLHIQDFNHTLVDYSWRSGTHRYDGGDVDTDYVLVGLRIATPGTAEDEEFIRESLQPQAVIAAASAIPFEPHFDPALTRRVRDALLPEYERLDDTYDTVKYDIRAVTDWEKWTYAVAGQFGLSPEDTAMYPPFAPPGTRGGVTSRASFDAVPAQAFFSLTVYDADRFLMSDDHNIVSSTRPGFITRPDGGFDVIFGGADARELAAREGVNYLNTPKDGWNGILRAYRPDVDRMRNYRMPELQPLDDPPHG
jgi:hypothetical protein